MLNFTKPLLCCRVSIVILKPAEAEGRDLDAEVADLAPKFGVW